MPIRKFCSVNDMPGPPEARPGDPRNLLRALELSEWCAALNQYRPVPGVHKHRSVQEARAARLERETGRRR